MSRFPIDWHSDRSTAIGSPVQKDPVPIIQKTQQGVDAVAPFLEAFKSFFIARFGLIRGEVSLSQRVEMSEEGIR